MTTFTNSTLFEQRGNVATHTIKHLVATAVATFTTARKKREAKRVFARMTPEQLRDVGMEGRVSINRFSAVETGVTRVTLW